MGTIVLTSTGLSVSNIDNAVRQLIREHRFRNVAIVTTASDEKAKNKYSQLARDQFRNMGIEQVDFVDLEFETIDFTAYDIIYVCGGNTFKLLKFVNKSHFKTAVQSLLRRNGMYIGVSAGSIIFSPTIDIANEVDPDPNDVGIKDLAGLDIVPFHVGVHYAIDTEEEVVVFEKRHDCKVERLTNEQALIINSEGSIQRIG